MLRPAFSFSKHARLPLTGYRAHLTFCDDVFMDRGREMQVCVVDRGLMIRWAARCYLVSGERVNVCLVQRHLDACFESESRSLKHAPRQCVVLAMRVSDYFPMETRDGLEYRARADPTDTIAGTIHTCEHHTKAWARSVRHLILLHSEAVFWKPVIVN